MKKLFFGALMLSGLKTQSQCVSNAANVYAFSVNNVPYEIVKENKTWADASACAVARGGKLVEIDSKAEQDTLFYHLNHAGIIAANTKAPDGGNASYVWLGGTDRLSEGYWFWDGSNIGTFYQFWQGTSTGSAVNGQYTNWGNEPDNFNEQDGLGLAVTNWPLGSAGQWNDVDELNQLYYVIEYPMVIPTSIPLLSTDDFSVYPNPADGLIHVTTKNVTGSAYTIINTSGAVILKGKLQGWQTEINIMAMPQGIYTILFEKGQNYRLIKK